MEYKLLNKQEYIKYLPQLQELFKKCFNRSMDEKYFKWRYIDNTNQDLLVYVALENEKVIANYSVFPCNLCRGDEIKKAALSMTTMTHPDYTGRGIFVKLAENLYNEMIKRGYDVVFGFPNNNSHRTFISKLKWKDIYEIPTMSLLTENLEINIIDSEYEIIKDNEFKLDYSKLFLEKKYIHIEKNNNYLRWRFSENPINKYINYVLTKDDTVFAHCVVKPYIKGEIDIVYANSIDPSLLKILINNIIVINQEKIKKVNTWVPIGSDNHILCEKMGFTNITPITYFGAKILNDYNEDIIFNFKEWYIQMGDSDVY